MALAYTFWRCSCWSDELKSRDQLRQEPGPVGHTIDQDAFVRCMSPFAHAAQAVQRRDAERSRKITVRAATRHGFFELNAQFPRELLSGAEELNNGHGTFHGRPVQSAGHFDLAAFIERLQSAKFAIEYFRIAQTRDTNVHYCARFCRHDVRARAAGDQARIYRDAALQIRESANALDLAGQFHDGARARGEIDAGVRGPSVHVYGLIAHVFARGPELSFK